MKFFLKNLEACDDLKKKISSSFGPNGMNKLMLQKNGRILISSDTVSILNNLKFIHPASKILVFSALFQEQELGDNAGTVILLSTEILKQAYELLKSGFSTSEIIQNFEEAGRITLKILNSLVVHRLINLKNLNLVKSVLFFCTKESDRNFNNHIAPQIAFICSRIFSTAFQKFSKENLRVIKIIGGSINETKTISGSVILKDTEGSVKNTRKANIVMFSCLFDLPGVETKNSFLFKKPQDILSYEKDLTNSMEEKITTLHQKGINVIIANGFGDSVLGFLEKYKIMAIKITSKFDLKRIASTSGSTVLSRVKVPSSNEIGKCDFVSVRAFAHQKVIIFKQEISENKIFTIIARGSTTHVLDKIERIIHRAASVFKTIARDSRFVAGGGACELELYRRLNKIASKKKEETEKIIFEKFAESFEIIPSTLLVNSGSNSLVDLSFLHSVHSSGWESKGVNIKGKNSFREQTYEVLDSFPCKYWSIKHAIDSAIILLSIDQVIMSRDFSKNLENTEN